MPPLYACLSEGAVAFLCGWRWPRPSNEKPGPWVQADLDAPREAIRGVPLEQLPWWLDDELWEIELAGDTAVVGRAVTGDRARLLRPVEAWTADVARELVSACEQRVREAGLDEYAADVVLYAQDAGRPAAAAGVAAYIAAHALAGGDQAAVSYEEAFAREREWQAGWLKQRLQL